MITIFNRRELIVTYDLNVQAEIRDKLALHKIDYVINPAQITLNINRCAAEYKFYVRKVDYEQALAVIYNKA